MTDTNATEFNGTTPEMRTDSPWLAGEDIMDRGRVKVTIEGVRHHKNVKFEQGRTVKDVFSLRFKGGRKELVLNATNRKRLVKMYGTKVAAWKGKEIQIYFDAGVMMAGKKVGGIRIVEGE